MKEKGTNVCAIYFKSLFTCMMPRCNRDKLDKKRKADFFQRKTHLQCLDFLLCCSDVVGKDLHNYNKQRKLRNKTLSFVNV